jgi:membrane protein insertase Oxa1/YidC/SpoIIIJ
MVLYWLSYNVFTMGQQLYLLRRYHEPLAFIDSEHVITEVPAPQDDAGAPAKKKQLPKQSGAAKTYKVKKKTKGANS